MWFGIVSLFPEMFQALDCGITGRAIKDQRVQLNHWNPRHYVLDKYQSVDDRPYGGGPGMLMMVKPLQTAIQTAKQAAPEKPLTIYVSPQGKRFDQKAAQRFTQQSSLIFVAGRYEGIDQRLIEQEIDEEWSIGDYVISGGELAAMVMIDAITRLLPGVLGDAQSAIEDSLAAGLLKYPQYTRPECLEGSKVPDILLSGHHERIAEWRLKMALGTTWLKRPDLLAQKTLSAQEQTLLAEFIAEHASDKFLK